MMLIPTDTHSSWKELLTEQNLKRLREIEENLGENFNPIVPENILRFLNVDLNQVKIVWLGQDVYPAKGVATGRSFEVGNLMDWNVPFRQVSLKNIIRLIHKTYCGIKDYDEIKNFHDIQLEIKEGIFPIKKPSEWFDSLEKQGVLFLNTSFTCEIGKPNSHKELWKDFSNSVIKFISSERSNVIWFLWGKEAMASKLLIEQGEFFESRHPMMCSKKYVDDFLKSSCFKSTMTTINWLG